MAIKRYIADADTTITNAYKRNLTTRGTGSNSGESENLEVFSIYAQATTSSTNDSTGEAKNRERTRMLVKFPITDISTDRTNKEIPASGSVSFYLNLYNARHLNTLPDNFTLAIQAVSASWEEGFGIDLDEYEDRTHDVEGANWDKRAGSTAWTAKGGDVHAAPVYTQIFSGGVEDMSVDISSLVEQWIAGTKSNYGVRIALTSSQETSTSRSYYTKKFYSRHADQKFFLRPALEARWDSALTDDSANFYLSSSLAPAADNLNTVYLYNRIRGQLVDVAALGASQSTSTKLHIKVYPTLGSSAKSHPIGGGVTVNARPIVTASWVEQGVYSASFAYSGSETTIYPVWQTTAGAELHSGSAITVNTFGGSADNAETQYVTSITNLKATYTRSETARFRLYIRNKDWSPTVYTTSTTAANSTIVPTGYWRLRRVKDDMTVFEYGTGSTNHTKMSYDQSGSYFDLDMSLLEKGYAYGLKFIYEINGNYHEQPDTFKFRVD